MNCTPGLALLALVISCCQNFILAGDVCTPKANSDTSRSGQCLQRCVVGVCNLSCNYDDCQQTCVAGTCALSCFDSRICSQSCTIACPQLSCQADTCTQTCTKSDCPHMECNATKECKQSCNHKNCKTMSCHAPDASCSQSGYGKMTCNSDSCTQSCTNNSCTLTCNATTCMQTCGTNDCSMTCLPGVKECTQNCTSGECPFTCNKATTKCVQICPECRSSGIPLRATYVALIILAFQSISTLI